VVLDKFRISAQPHLSPESEWLIGFYSGTSGFIYEETAECECIVANHFGLQSRAEGTGPEAVFRIVIMILGAEVGRLAVGSRGDDLANHSLRVPSVLTEINSEPIEQFGMGRELSLSTEVCRGTDDSVAEEKLPKLIRCDAGGEGVVLGEKPVCESETVGRRILRHGRENGRGARRDDFVFDGGIILASVE
jgi:hypothetical protein